MKESKNKEAIKLLYDMEMNNYKMTRTISRLNYEISCLGNPAYIHEPAEPQYPEFSRGEVGCLPITLGGILGLVFGIALSVPAFEDGFFGFFLGMFCLALGLGLGVFVGWGCGVIKKEIDRTNREDEAYKKSKANYVIECELYEEKMQNDAIRVEKEKRQKAILIAERDFLIQRREHAQEFLKKCYVTIGIDAMFRSLIPIAKMYEIVSLGITDRFGGENGLYDRVRRELREDAFYVKLEEIIQKLDTIISQNDRLYQEIGYLNQQCEKMISASRQSAQLAAQNNVLLQQAIKNTEISAYHAERIAAEERYQSFLMTYHEF